MIFIYIILIKRLNYYNFWYKNMKPIYINYFLTDGIVELIISEDGYHSPKIFEKKNNLIFNYFFLGWLVWSNS